MKLLLVFLLELNCLLVYSVGAIGFGQVYGVWLTFFLLGLYMARTLVFAEYGNKTLLELIHG